jgi:ABC-2 type transport system permease protein
MSDLAPAPTDRGMWLVVARRDFKVRLRDKGFAISTGITVAVLSLFILIRAYGGAGTPTFDLGVVGDATTASAAVLVADQQGVKLHLHPYDTRNAAERALLAGTVDGVLDGDRLTGKDAVPAQLQTVVEAAAVGERIRGALSSAGVPDDQISKALDPSPVAVDTLRPPDPHRESNAAVAFIGVLLLYGQLFGYGVWVATGVIEEKASRVVEILLATISPRQLLAGKVAGIGTLGLIQLACIAGFAIMLATLTHAVSIPASALGAALLVLGWFVLGFAFYAGLFAVSGALVSRMEDLQNAMVPINIIILVSFFIAIGSLQDPNSTIAVVASLVPFSSALAMPVRIVLGAASGPQIVASIAILVGSTALLVPLAGRLYAGAVLRTGSRVKLRDAWRASA